MYHDRSQRQRYSHLRYDVGTARQYEKRTRRMFEMVGIGASLKCNSSLTVMAGKVIALATASKISHTIAATVPSTTHPDFSRPDSPA